MNIKELAFKYVQLKKQEKVLKKQIKDTNEKLKSYMISNNVSEIDGIDWKVSIVSQDRSKMNEDRLIHKLQDMGLEVAISSKPVVDQEKLSDLLYEGKLNDTDLMDCVDKKIISMLKLTTKKED